MDDNTRYYLAEHMAALQREYAILKTALDQDTELQQIKQLLKESQGSRAVPQAVEGEVIDA